MAMATAYSLLYMYSSLLILYAINSFKLPHEFFSRFIDSPIIGGIHNVYQRLRTHVVMPPQWTDLVLAYRNIDIEETRKIRPVTYQNANQIEICLDYETTTDGRWVLR